MCHGFLKEASRCVLEEDHGLEFNIPRDYNEASLVLETPNGADPLHTPLGAIDAQTVRSPEDIDFTIAAQHFRPVQMRFEGFAEGQALLQVFLNRRGTLSLVHADTYATAAPVTLRLLPGTYEFEVVPQGEHHMMWLAQFLPPKLVLDPQQRLEEVVLFETDPLHAQDLQQARGQWRQHVQAKFLYENTLTTDAINALQGSAHALAAVLWYSSETLAQGGDRAALLPLWQGIYGQVFAGRRSATYKRRLSRAMQNVALSDPDSGELRADAFTILEWMFTIFLNQCDPVLSRQTEDSVVRRQRYNNWLGELTESEELIGPALQQILHAKEGAC